LLRQLLVSAAEIPIDYDLGGRDGLVMQLLVAEIDRAPVIPIAVPFPRHPALVSRCHAFLEEPQATATIDQWSAALSMNRRRFTRLFRRETGMSFAEWRQQACLSVALPRLAAGEAITSIAFSSFLVFLLFPFAADVREGKRKAAFPLPHVPLKRRRELARPGPSG
ncbi:MAG: helix-turn-helix domain-containing protein, partial [Sphingomonas sp.]|nr:helix-turn-helix domain-containing protein [Sphingomonas sp.]